jgi:type I restriction-modification system DNA methylase subunit
MANDLDRIRAIKSFPSLIKYLRDDLGWEFETDDVEELTFEYEPEELGLDAKTAVKIKDIKQLRPLVTNQPWGIFYINFEPKRLPVVVLRRILRSLVIKRRASANRGQQAAWKLNDLLFISSYGESDERAMTFAHFSDSSEVGDLPTLKVLGWDAQDTVLHLEDVHRTLKEKLHFPDDPSDVEAWREQWSSAFTLRHREVVTTSIELAKRLAELATLIRERANRVLAIESEKGAFRRLQEAFREALIHDLSADDFADMYAQTIAYGLLSARVSRPEGLVADNLVDMVPSTNPFLKELLGTFLKIGGRDTSRANQKANAIDFDELGINEVVELLRRANIEAVLRDFGNRNPTEDPVIHFYELFLKEYDPVKRMKRGVFYTPRPVVSFIVRSVDEILRREFKLEYGLADTATWREISERHEGLKIPEGVSPDAPFVQVLDPATGTSTFIVETIDLIYTTMLEKWRGEHKSEREIRELWNDYVPKHLLPRVYGFELMMAPYAIAHMKIGLKLRETGYSFLSSERARIYLTNTLEEPKDFSSYFAQMAPALAHEAAEANTVKRHTPITVIIGNPPYSKMSANLGEDAVNLVKPFRYLDGEKIVEKGALAFELSIQDDYVKFFGFMLRKLLSTPLRIGAYITNFRFLNSTFLRGLRQTILNNFPGTNFVNLGGHVANRSTIKNADENVFDIEQGVAISFLRASHSKNRSSVGYFRLFGTREIKYQQLLGSNATGIKFTELSPSSPSYKFTEEVGDDEASYDSWMSLEEIFSFNSGGVITSRDNLAIAFDAKSLMRNMKDFANSPKGDTSIQERLGFTIKSKWNVEDCKRRLFSEGIPQKYIKRILYRPFDIRQIYYYIPLLDTPSRPVCNALDGGGNLVLLSPKVKTTPTFNHVMISRYMAEKKSCSHDRATQMFPLWVKDSSRGLIEGGDYGRSNISERFQAHLRQKLGSENITPEDVLHYIYAILHSPTHRSMFGGNMQDDFPRVPLTTDRALFRTLCHLGANLVALHLLEDDYADASWNTDSGGKAENNEIRLVDTSPLASDVVRFHDAGSKQVAKGFPKYDDGKVHINPASYFDGVSEAVWNFHVGGYQVAHKWLKDRRERTLSPDDITHYTRTCHALASTLEHMSLVDEVVEAHGGFPLVGSQDAAPIIKEATNALPFE